MALLKKIIKADQREVIVKWTGSGTDTLTLAALLSTGQTLTGVTPVVNILAVSSSIDSTGVGTITRNGEITLYIHDNFEFQTDGIIQSVLDENSTSDIIVNLTTPSTLLIRLKKMQGYSIIT